MKLTEADLCRLYQESAVGGECPEDDLLLRAARGELNRGERESVAAHVAACNDCARYYQVAYAMRPLAVDVVPMRRSWQWLAAAAMLFLALPLVIWSAVQHQRDAAMIESLRKTVRAAEERPVVIPKTEQPAAQTEPAPIQLAEGPRTHIDTPIVDLDPDPTRSGGESVARVVLAPTSDVFTLILHLDEAVRGTVPIAIEDAKGTVMAKETWVAPARTTSVTLTLDRRRFAPGYYRVRIGGAAYRFQVAESP